jgi:hypothetical protein
VERADLKKEIKILARRSEKKSWVWATLGRKRGPNGTAAALSQHLDLHLASASSSRISLAPAPQGPRGREAEARPGVAQPGWSPAPPPAARLPSSGSGCAARGNLQPAQPMKGRRPAGSLFLGLQRAPRHCGRHLELRGAWQPPVLPTRGTHFGCCRPPPTDPASFGAEPRSALPGAPPSHSHRCKSAPFSPTRGRAFAAPVNPHAGHTA